MLMAHGGPDAGLTFPLPTGMTAIGRGPLCDIVVQHPSVSWQHVGILSDAGGYWISDLGSKNGTFVNGVRLGLGHSKLSNFDRIELGGPHEDSVSWVFMESTETIEMPRPPSA